MQLIACCYTSKVFVGPSRANGLRRMMGLLPLTGESHFLPSHKVKEEQGQKSKVVKKVGKPTSQKLQKAKHSEAENCHRHHRKDNKSRKHDAGKLTITSLKPPAMTDTTSLNRNTIK